MKTGVYNIINILTNDQYIGSSRNLNQRKLKHFSLLRTNSHYAPMFQKAFNKYGIDNFKFNIIEECSIEELTIKEQYYIDLLKPAYNVNQTVHNGFSHRAREKSVQITSKVVYQYDIDGTFIRKWNSISEAARQLNIDFKNISQSAIKQNRQTKGFMWRYFYIEKIQPHLNNAVKSIVLLNGNEILKEWNSIKDCMCDLKITRNKAHALLNNKTIYREFNIHYKTAIL